VATVTSDDYRSAFGGMSVQDPSAVLKRHQSLTRSVRAEAISRMRKDLLPWWQRKARGLPEEQTRPWTRSRGRRVAATSLPPSAAKDGTGQDAPGWRTATDLHKRDSTGRRGTAQYVPGRTHNPSVGGSRPPRPTGLCLVPPDA
jgi:hypothetical protein